MLGDWCGDEAGVRSVPSEVSGDPGVADNGEPHSRRLDGVLGTLLYWFDCYGDDGRPSHTKLAAITSFFYGLGFGAYFILTGAPYWFLLSWTSLTFAVPYGLKGLAEWLHRDPGTTPVH